MTDLFTKQERSKIMSHIRSSNTKPELLLKTALKGSYLRYQPKMYGRPDFANKTRRIAVFVDGCFWHKCPNCHKEPKSNTYYWIPKLERNAQRDEKINRVLRKKGWKVFRIWEHDVRKDPEKVADKISLALKLADSNLLK